MLYIDAHLMGIRETLARYPESMTRWKEQRVAALALLKQIECAAKILTAGLEYHEHDGHDMPKKVAREALEALGVPRKDQP